MAEVNKRESGRASSSTISLLASPPRGRSTCGRSPRLVPTAVNRRRPTTPQLETWKTELRTLFNTPPYPQGYAVWEGTPRDARLHQRGQPDQPGPRVPRQFIQLLGGHRLPPQAIGSGRLELADWLTAADSPLLARVFVNRIWQHHFGRGLVPTENDFGTRGQSPSHPELLDWLAAAFVESGWSVKAMHRRIMLSQVYQQGSAGSPAMRASDPSNIWLARFARRRLDAESIRDALLAVSGRLDDRMGGPHPFPEYLQTRYTQHGPFRGEYQTDRRSVYLMTRRLKQHSFLALFDGADTNASTARRATSTVATQALFMMNDPMVHELSEAIAAALIARHDAAAARIRDAFERTLARPPREIEQAEARALLEAYRAQTPLRFVGGGAYNQDLGGARPHAIRPQRVHPYRLTMFPTRREWLQRAGGGFGAIAAATLLAEADAARPASDDLDPLASRPPHRPATVKRVIFLHMGGGVSHVDTFDYKPRLVADHGKTVAIDNWQGRGGDFRFYLSRPKWPFRPGGECGTLVSDLFPAIRGLADELCVIPFAEHQSHQPLREHAGDAHRVVRLRPTEPGSVGELRTRHVQSQSALVCRYRAADAVRRCANVGVRFSAGLPSGHANPARQDANCEPRTADGFPKPAGVGVGIGGSGKSPVIKWIALATPRWRRASVRLRRPSACRSKRPLHSTCPAKARPR